MPADHAAHICWGKCKIDTVWETLCIRGRMHHSHDELFRERLGCERPCASGEGCTRRSTCFDSLFFRCGRPCASGEGCTFSGGMHGTCIACVRDLMYQGKDAPKRSLTFRERDCYVTQVAPYRIPRD